jgi:hypothetical protein
VVVVLQHTIHPEILVDLVVVEVVMDLNQEELEILHQHLHRKEILEELEDHRVILETLVVEVVLVLLVLIQNILEVVQVV